jgi:subtilisin family serine protease
MWKILTFRAKSADDYFTRLKAIHNVTQTNTTVCVAMLDSGINEHHPEIAEHIKNGSITLWEGFPKTLNPLEDKCGHGTHGASVLLKTAPKVELLIARVFDDDGKMPYMDKYPAVV